MAHAMRVCPACCHQHKREYPPPSLQLLGGILFVSGAAGVWGGRRRSASLVNLHLLGCLLGTLLAFSLVSEVRPGPGACHSWMVARCLTCTKRWPFSHHPLVACVPDLQQA